MAQKKGYSINLGTIVSELNEIENQSSRLENVLKFMDEDITAYAISLNNQIDRLAETNKKYNDLKKRHSQLVKDLMADLKALGVEPPTMEKSF
jgi:chromosome segregation ATPase